jgi:uncharacterized SAM-binding protein YcdF (DUF218 family)
MQFVFSKILSFLYYPFNWVLIISVIAFFTRKILWKKRLFKIALLFFFFFSNKFIYNKICLAYQPKPIDIHTFPACNVGILLGGVAGYDKDSIGFFNQSSDRFIQTLQLYKLGKIKKIIVSGGTSKILHKEKDEASYLYQSFINCGVNKSDLIIEDKARNTEENIIYSKLILDSLDINNGIVIITSAFHVPRTNYIAKKHGMNSSLIFPCNYIEINSYLSFSDYFLPNMKAMNDWAFLIKEWIGLGVYWIKG